MRFRLLLAAAACFLLLPAFLLRWSAGGNNSGGQIELVRTFTQASGATNNFWLIGQPFVSYPSPNAADVPSGDVINVTTGATLGGTAIRVGTCAQKYDHAGDLSWAAEMVDFSNASIAGGGGNNLVMTTSGGSWNQTTTATDADWKALHDTVTINPVSTYSAGGNDMNVGPYVATFDGSAGSTETITDLCDSPVGHMVKVVSTLYNSTNSVAHCYLQAEMFYWVTENASGGHGISNSPIASKGPRILNDQPFQYSTAHGGPCSGDNGVFYGMTVTWARNGHQMRQFTNVAIPALTKADVVRADGEWDWDDSTDFGNNTINVHSDPGVVVTQTIPELNLTYKLPPLWHQTAITYTGGAVYSGSGWSQMSYSYVPITTVATGLFTTGSGQNAIGTVVNPQGNPLAVGINVPIAMQFTGSLNGLTGLHLNAAFDPTATVYWSCYQSSTTFYIYDNEVDATACGATGKITPGGTYGGSGLNAEMAVGPESVGMYSSLDAGVGGDRPELSYLGEWASGYLFGNTQLWQEQARTQAYALDSMPMFVRNSGTNGSIPSFLDSTTLSTCCGSKTNMAGGTGLGTAQTTTLWEACDNYTNIYLPTGSGVANTPAAYCGFWSPSTTHMAADACFIIWMMEADPLCQQMAVEYGNEGGANLAPVNSRNLQNTQVGGGTTYYDVAGNSSGRQLAWDERDVGEAAFAATQGSAEEAYYRQQLANMATWENAYIAWKDTGPNNNYNLWGQYFMDDVSNTCCTGVIGTQNAPYNSFFMTNYGAISFSEAARLNGDYVPSFKTFADTTINVEAAQLGASCPWFSDLYVYSYNLSPDGATPPGSYGTLIGLPANGQNGDQEYIAVGGATNTIQAANPTAPAEWQGGAGVNLAFQTGDEFVPFGTSPNVTPGALPPSGLTQGTIYYIINASGNTFQLATTPTGSAINLGTSLGITQTASSTSFASGTLTINTPLANGIQTVLGGNSPVILTGFGTNVPDGVYGVTGINSTTQFTVAASGAASANGTVAPLFGGYMIPAGVNGSNCPSSSAGGFDAGKNDFYGIQTAGAMCAVAERQNNATLKADCTTGQTWLLNSSINTVFGGGTSAWAFQGTP